MASIRKRLRRIRLLSSDGSPVATSAPKAAAVAQEPESPKKEKTLSPKKAPKKASKQSAKKAD